VTTLMTDLVLEKIGGNNFDEFLSLIEQLAQYEKLTPPDAEAKERLRNDAIRPNPAYEACLGRYNGIAAGYVTFYFTYSTFLARPTLYLEDIFVREEYRHRGFGETLIDYCRSIAKERGCGRMEWMVLTWNKPALQFYEKSGAQRLDWYVYRLNREQL